MSSLFLSAARRRISIGSFLGEVPASEFITGTHIAYLVNLTVGTVQNDNESWLKFKDPVDAKIKYVAKKPLRRNISWAELNLRGLVTGKTIEIAGKRYIVRLLEGLGRPLTDLSSNDQFDHPDTHGSEWNRLLYHVSGKPFENAENTLASEGIEEGDLAQYSESDLGMVGSNVGAACWCKESYSAYRVYRGFWGVSRSALRSSFSNPDTGWRPVLELIE